MVRLETTLLDKLVNKNLLKKRNLGRALKPKYFTKHERGIVEICYKPQGTFQTYLAAFLNGMMPYLSKFTYQFHAEKARLAGLRVEDTYDQKFFREPYILWHVYAQNFHPDTLLERVRNVHFYRKTNTLFKGFQVPDWARSEKGEGGFDQDIYSRMAWKNALKDLKSEWTPMPFAGQRLEPNAIQWARHEHFGKGHSSRFFYNEVPNPTTIRNGGNFEGDKLHSWTFADQAHEDLFGFETRTPEGRERLANEIRRWKQITPEIFEKYDPDAAYEVQPFLSEEPHFRRVWNHYRQFQFNARVEFLINQGDLDSEDLAKARPYFDANGLPSPSLLNMAQKGLLGDVQNEPSYEAFTKVLKWLGLDTIEFDNATSAPIEEQFFEQFDSIFELNEAEMREHLPLFIGNDQRARLEAAEETRRLA
jgi:hypothetical protein